MHIRHATRSDVGAVAQLWMHTFPGERGLAERIHDLEAGGAYGGIETVEVAEENGQLAAALKILRLTQNIAGAPLPAMGLAAVGVAPFARRRGLAAELCHHALRAARERGDVVSGLYPFRPDFYRRLGWATVGELHTYRFRPESLEAPARTPVRLASAADEPAIAQCYARVAGRSNGLIERTERIWRRHLDAPATHAFVHVDNGVRGYMLVRYGRGAGREQRLLFIRELVAEDDAVYADLCGWISLQRDLWRHVRYDAAPDEQFWLRLRDPRPPGSRGTRWLWDPVARVIRGPMLRIVNVTEAIRRRRVWGPSPALTFTLAVGDPELPANEGPFVVEFDGATAVVGGAAKETAVKESAIRISTDVGTLAQLWVGELTVGAAIRHGRARVEGDVPALEALLRPNQSFRLLDEF